MSVSREAGGFEICKEASWGGDEPINPLHSDFFFQIFLSETNYTIFENIHTHLRFEDSCDLANRYERNVDERSLERFKDPKGTLCPPLSVEKSYQVAGEKIIVFGYNISIQRVE